MEELKLSNERFTPGKRTLKLGSIKPKPILLEIGKPLAIKLNEVSDPMTLIIDEVSLNCGYPIITVDIKLSDYTYCSRFYRRSYVDIYDNYPPKVQAPKIYVNPDGTLCINGKVIGNIDEYC